MNKLTGFALAGAVALLLPLAAPSAQEAEQEPMPMPEEMAAEMGSWPGHRMMHGGHGGMMGMGRGRAEMHGWKGGMHHGLGAPRFLEMHAEELELSDEQVAQIKELWSNHKKSAIRTKADVRIAEMELEEILGQQPVDFDKAKAKIERIGSLRLDMEVGMLEAMRKSHDVLTEEQQDKLMMLRRHGCCGSMQHGATAKHCKKTHGMRMKD